MKAVAWIIFAMVFEISIVVMLAISSFGQGIPMPHTMPAPSNSYFKLTLAWDANTNPVVAGYYLRQGTNGIYFNTNQIVGPGSTNYTYTNLTHDRSTQCFEAATYSTGGVMSKWCSEIHWPRPLVSTVFYIFPATNFLKTHWIACAPACYSVTNPFNKEVLFDLSNHVLRDTFSLQPPNWFSLNITVTTNAIGLRAGLTNFYGQ